METKRQRVTQEVLNSEEQHRLKVEVFLNETLEEKLEYFEGDPENKADIERAILFLRPYEREISDILKNAGFPYRDDLYYFLYIFTRRLARLYEITRVPLEQIFGLAGQQAFFTFCKDHRLNKEQRLRLDWHFLYNFLEKD